jgi:hypothetical protein
MRCSCARFGTVTVRQVIWAAGRRIREQSAPQNANEYIFYLVTGMQCRIADSWLEVCQTLQGFANAEEHTDIVNTVSSAAAAQQTWRYCASHIGKRLFPAVLCLSSSASCHAVQVTET